MDPGRDPPSILPVAATLVVVGVTIALVSFVVDSVRSALAIAVLGMYLLHLLTLRRIRDTQEGQWEALRDLLGRITEPPEEERAGPRPRSRPGGASRSPGATPPGEPAPGPRRSGARNAGGAAAADTADPASGTPAAAGGGPGRAPASGQAPASGGGTPPPGDPLGAVGSGDLWRENDVEEGEVLVPKKFALGTVALVRKKMTPAEIDEVLREQEDRTGEEYFGQVAVDLGYLDQQELDELLEAQAEGLFRAEEIEEARRRLKAYKATRPNGSG